MACYVINKESVAPVIVRFIIAHLLNEGINLTMNSLEILLPYLVIKKNAKYTYLFPRQIHQRFFILLTIIITSST